jgi:hypothetical protein
MKDDRKMEQIQGSQKKKRRRQPMNNFGRVNIKD